MRFEGLRRILVGLLIDSQMARGAAVDSRNRFERLIVVEIAQDDLVDALRRFMKSKTGALRNETMTAARD